MRSLNLDQLRALSEIVRLGSFSAAARALNLSQPAVSLQLRELESRAGVRLVERLGKRAFATPAGTALIAHAERLGAEAEAALVTMRRHRDGALGRVRIGTSFVILNYLLPPVLKRLRDAHPDLELQISLGSSAQKTAQILRNEIDIAIVTLPAEDPRLDVEVLRDDRMLALLPPGTKAPPRLAPRDFARWPLILDAPGSRMGQIVRDWFAVDSDSPRPAMEVGDVHAIKTLVASGLGASILPSDALHYEAARGEVLLRPLTPPVTISIGLVQRRDKPGEPALAIVRTALREALKEIGKRPGPGGDRRNRAGPARR